jgi:hypothetical protein
MDENRLNILKESRREISRLQLLSAFFEEDAVYKIYLRSQVIHQMFENNEELDIEKLDLFHVQFTSSVIELLRKIKKSNEKNVSLIYDEVHLNEELIAQMNNQLFSEKAFHLDKLKQASKVNLSLRRLFEVLSDLSTDFPFSKNINAFSSRYAKDFFHAISPDELGLLTNYDPKNTYVSSYATIERKLMGLLCKQEFQTEFFCGLKSGQLVAEVYKFLDIDRYFLFFPSRNLFLFCDLSVLNKIDLSANRSEKEKLIQELAYKNDKLQANAAAQKTFIPKEIIDLLEENYLKISDINFIDHLNNFDVQANILKAMLKTDLF